MKNVFGIMENGKCINKCETFPDCKPYGEMENGLKPVEGEAYRIAKETTAEAWLIAAGGDKNMDTLNQSVARRIEAYAVIQPYNKAEALKTGKDKTFGEAVKALKDGRMVSREGWNGKGMWLKMVGKGFYDVGVSIAEGTKLLPWIGMKTAGGEFVPWLASQTDVLAEDWCILN